MGVVSRRLSPLRGLRDGDRDLGILWVPYRGWSTKAACGLPDALSGSQAQGLYVQHYQRQKIECVVEYCLEHTNFALLGCARVFFFLTAFHGCTAYLCATAVTQFAKRSQEVHIRNITFQT